MKVLAEITEILGHDSLPARAVKAMHAGRVTPDEVDSWLRAKHLKEWQQVIREYVNGDLFSSQKLGWVQWSTAYHPGRQWTDRVSYERAWNAAFCSCEEHSPEWREINLFYTSRCDSRYTGMTPESIANLKNDFREKVQRKFHTDNEENGWGDWVGHA